MHYNKIYKVVANIYYILIRIYCLETLDCIYVHTLIDTRKVYVKK